jgi:hypothetical protein
VYYIFKKLNAILASDVLNICFDSVTIFCILQYSFVKRHLPVKPKATRGLEPISYRAALLSILLHSLLNVLIQIANKMGLQKKENVNT